MFFYVHRAVNRFVHERARALWSSVLQFAPSEVSSLRLIVFFGAKFSAKSCAVRGGEYVRGLISSVSAGMHGASIALDREARLAAQRAANVGGFDTASYSISRTHAPVAPANRIPKAKVFCIFSSLKRFLSESQRWRLEPVINVPEPSRSRNGSKPRI